MQNSKYRQALISQFSVPVQEREVNAGSVRTTYLEAGNGHPIVLLHGAGAGAVAWYPTMGALAERFRVIAPDIVGYGESDKPKGRYDRPYFAKWLKNFLEALGVSRAHVVGSSQGGAIALEFALSYPETVDKLVLVNAGALGAQPPFDALAGIFWMNLFPSLAASRYLGRRLVCKPEGRNENLDHYSVEVVKKPGGKYPFKRGRGSAVAPIAAARLRQLNKPTLIIWGEKDQLFPCEVGEAASRVIPHARFHLIKNAAHVPQVEQPSAFNQAVLQFLRDPQIGVR